MFNLCGSKQAVYFYVRGFGCALFYFTEVFAMSFAETLKAARKAKKLTQQQLADELKVDRSAIAHYENGTAKPQFDCIPKICELLDLKYEEIFD